MSTSNILRIESSQRMFGLLRSAEPASESVGHWTVRELYTPNVHNDIDARLGSYQVILEVEVDSPAEVEDRLSEGVEIAEQLEHLWLYATGLTLHGKGFSLSFANVEPPSRWRSNIKEVRRATQARHSLLIGEVSVQSLHSRFGSMLPLKPALRVREKYALTDDITRALAGLHYHAHTARGFEESAFLLAKALELVRKVLPGRTDPQKEEKLPAEVRASLDLKLSALYKLSNARFETRHAVPKEKKKKEKEKVSPGLNPRMGSEELLKFLGSADTVVRAVVCDRLGVDQVITRSGSPTETA